MHEISYRVYYEDTDAGGVVYYANYLKFLERARTEFLRSLGFEQTDLITQHGIAFVVRSVNIDYLSPARLDDMLLIRTIVPKINRSSMFFTQDVWLEDKKISTAKIQIVCLDVQGFKPKAIPDFLKTKLKSDI